MPAIVLDEIRADSDNLEFSFGGVTINSLKRN